MKNKYVWIVVAALVSFTSFTGIAQAQDKVTVQLSPSMVTVTEGESGKNVSGMEYRASPIQLVTTVRLQDGLKVRGHVALPSGSNLPAQYVAYDNGHQILSTDQPQLN